MFCLGGVFVFVCWYVVFMGSSATKTFVRKKNVVLESVFQISGPKYNCKYLREPDASSCRQNAMIKKKMEFSDVRVFIVEIGLWIYFLAQKLE